jgi:DNA-binding Xre family transcriptional regulator
MDNISRNIRKYRKESFLKLAKKAGLSYSSLENIIYVKKKDVQITTLQKIAKALNVSLDDLVK